MPQVVFDLAKNDEIQEQRKKLVGIPSSGSQIEYSRALAYVEAMSKVPREDFTAGVMHRYIEGLSIIGDYAQAYELSGDKMYKDVDDAITGKNKQCKCKPTVTMVLEGGKPVQKEYSNIFVRTRVYDQLKHQFVNLNACNTCGRLTV